jgi:lanosterol synthase
MSADVATAAARAARNLVSRQHTDGHWEGEMAWCPVITAQVVITRHVVGRPFDPDEARRVLFYLGRTRVPAGAFGLHPEHAGSVFVTALVYVALRLLGLGPDHPLPAAARRWLHAQPGGVLAIPTWGKFWLALLGLYGREGLRPLPPEVVLLPRWVPVHPLRYYCHTRYVYLAMALLQGGRVRLDLGPIADPLRGELYGPAGPPERFDSHRYHFAATDVVEPPRWPVRWAERLLGWYDRHSSGRLRDAALGRCRDLIDRELAVSHGVTLSPINGVLSTLALHARGADSAAIDQCLRGLEVYRWDDDQGLRYSGGRSGVWDTAFGVEALLANPCVVRRHGDALQSAYRFLAVNQMLRSVADRDPLFPDRVVGGWSFSGICHAWPVSDCTAEAIAAVLAAHAAGTIAPGDRIPDDGLARAVEFILSRQNRDGGFGSYERARGPSWLNRLNPSEMFSQCMTDQSYVECTGSSLVALGRVRETLPNRTPRRIDRAIARGVRFLFRAQRRDGAFRGSWGVYMTYGTFHAVRGLRAAGVPRDSPALRRAAGWLVRHQKPDGGWGEHHTGCLRGRYVEHPYSQAVMTSWAVLALADVLGPDHEAVRRGAAWLASCQSDDGSWPREAVNGVFFGTAMLDYELYRAYFPLWALARVSGGPAPLPT